MARRGPQSCRLDLVARRESNVPRPLSAMGRVRVTRRRSPPKSTAARRAATPAAEARAPRPAPPAGNGRAWRVAAPVVVAAWALLFAAQLFAARVFVLGDAR